MLRELYEEKKRMAHLWPTMLYTFSKPKYQHPLNREDQETLSKYVRQVYNPKLKKLKESEHFREEWLEADATAKA